jgi:hypothetical protein
MWPRYTVPKFLQTVKICENSNKHDFINWNNPTSFNKIDNNNNNNVYLPHSLEEPITGIVLQSLFKNLKILDLENTLVVEIQKGILLYSCHIVRKFLNIDTEHKTQKSQNVEASAGNYVDKHCTITW